MINRLKPKSEFSRNVLTLMTGTTIAQAIPIAISPILTRIYTPEDFGVFALYMSIVSLIAVMATGRYELAIMLPKKDEDAIQIAMFSMGISLVISLLVLAGVYCFNAQITTLLANPEISVWLYLMPVSIMLTGLFQSFNYWNNRQKQYGLLAGNKVLKSSSTAALNLGLGFGGFNSSGLIVGNISGLGIATLFLGKTFFKEHQNRLKFLNRLKMMALMKKYKKFPMFNLPNAVIDNLRLSGIKILIAKFFSIGILGQFMLAWQMVQTPMALIGSSLSQVFFQKISSAEKEDLNIIVMQFIKKVSMIAIPIFMMIYFFAADMFVFLFGSNWEMAGHAASIMSPWLFLNFLSAPMANVFIVLNRQEIVLAVSIFYMAVPLGILFFLQEESFFDVLHTVTLAMSLILFVFISLAVIYTKERNR